MRMFSGWLAVAALATMAACSDGAVSGPAPRSLLPSVGGLDVVQWDGNGTNADGTCNKFQNDDEVETPPGMMSWHFVLTQAAPGGSTLSYVFDDGTDASTTEHKYTGGTYHFYVFTTAGAKLLSASATNGTAGSSNLNVSHCETGTTENTASIRTDIHNSAHEIILAVTGFETVHDQADVTTTGTGPAPTGTVTFKWFSNGTCTDDEEAEEAPEDDFVDAGTVDIVAGVAHPSTAFAIVKEGFYSFLATYNGDANYAPVVAACEPLDASAITAAVLTADKTAAGSNDRTWTWGIEKSVDKTSVRQLSGTATFNYTVTVTHDGGAVSNVKVSGKITVSNPNPDPVAITGITDVVTDGNAVDTPCTVTGGGPQNIPSGETEFDYECDFGSTIPPAELTNVVTVSWDEQDLAPSGAHLLGGTAPFQVSPIAFTETKIDDCVDVTDDKAGALGTLCSTDPSPSQYNYSKEIAVPTTGCTEYDNTATFTTNTTGTTGTDDQSVTVCTRVAGGLTMGFWQNKNGQTIIASYSGANCAALKAWLTGYAPFADLTATICGTSPSLTGKSTTAPTGVVGYVFRIIKLANASGASMNAMLKAQMLATALDVYFSNPALGGNRINAPAPLGGQNVDLTYINKPIGSATFENTTTAFNDAPAADACQTVLELLAFAASKSNSGGSAWYGQVKARQELAKDTFDAINNAVAYSCP